MSKESDKATELDAILREAVDEKVAALMPKAGDVSEPVTLDPRKPMGQRMRRGDELYTDQAPPPDSAPDNVLVRGPEFLAHPDLDHTGALVNGGTGFVGGPRMTFDTANPQDMTNLANLKTTEALKTAAGGIAGGAIGGAATRALPVVRSLVAAKGLVPALVGAGLEGAGAGAGSTTGAALVHGQLPTGGDLAWGAGSGAAFGVGGRALGRAFAGAPARDDANMLRNARASGMTKPEYAKFFGSREGTLKTLRTDPELRGSLGKPEETLKLVDERLPAAHAEATKVLDTADAKNGRLPVVQTMNEVFGKTIAELQKIGGTANNQAADAAFRLSEQFKSGIGANNGKPPAASEIRRFLTEEVGSKLNANPNTEDSATNRAATLVYSKFMKLLDAHAEAASPGLGAELKALNEKQATYMMLRDAAQKNAVNLSTAKAPTWPQKLQQFGVRSALGELAGRHLAAATGVVDPEVGAVVGGAAGALVSPATANAVRGTGAAVTRAMASPTGQAIGNAIPTAVAGISSGGIPFVPKIIQAVKAGDRKAALNAGAAEVYGQP